MPLGISISASVMKALPSPGPVIFALRTLGPYQAAKIVLEERTARFIDLNPYGRAPKKIRLRFAVNLLVHSEHGGGALASSITIERSFKASVSNLIEVLGCTMSVCALELFHHRIRLVDVAVLGLKFVLDVNGKEVAINLFPSFQCEVHQSTDYRSQHTMFRSVNRVKRLVLGAYLLRTSPRALDSLRLAQR